MTTDTALAVSTYCTHLCTKYPNIKINPSHCERRREMASKTVSMLEVYPGSECKSCPGPTPRNPNPQQEEPSRMEPAENVFKSRKPFNPKCKCGESDPAKYYISSPYQCKSCMKKYQEGRSHPGNVQLPPEADTTQLVCLIHGPHNGGKIGDKWNRYCPTCMQEKRIKGLQKAFKQAVVLRLEGYGWLRQWLADQAGCDISDSSKIGDYAVRELSRSVPAEAIKDYLLREIRDA